MRNLLIKRIFPGSLFLSFFLHLLLLGAATIVIWQPVEKKTVPDLYTPSYVYKGGITSAASPKKNMTAKNQTASSSAAPRTSQGTQKQVSSKAMHKPYRQTVLGMTQNFLQDNQHEMITHSQQEEEPIYLVGDENSPVDPLVRLLGHALSAHFEYPREAGLFGIRGKALVGLTLHPDGRLTNVRLLQSTDNQDLDAAAIYAVNAAPIVRGVGKFISKPKYFVVGFIFR